MNTNRLSKLIRIYYMPSIAIAYTVIYHLCYLYLFLFINKVISLYVIVCSKMRLSTNQTNTASKTCTNVAIR